MQKHITSLISVALVSVMVFSNTTNLYALELSEEQLLYATNTSNHSNNRYYFDPVMTLMLLLILIATIRRIEINLSYYTPSHTINFHTDSGMFICCLTDR